MKCQIHGDDEKQCRFYSDTDCCIGEDEDINGGEFIYTKLYRAIDKLYERGWVDKRQERDYDPRGCREWQMLLDIFRIKNAA